MSATFNFLGPEVKSLSLSKLAACTSSPC